MSFAEKEVLSGYYTIHNVINKSNGLLCFPPQQNS